MKDNSNSHASKEIVKNGMRAPRISIYMAMLEETVLEISAYLLLVRQKVEG